MRINSSQNVQQMLKAYNKNVSKVKETEKTAFKSDKIEISESAKDFQVAMKAFSDLPEVREEKVDDLKKKIADGNYQPSAKDIAKKMLSDMKTNNVG
ncbi:MAG: flagellar biosynthesis anti-sigma factor FlgM [Clostridia bacterium]|nr:flagellar biosynthesis anti-sigma factor FlgM [Clostridia bacterium]